MNDAIEVVFSLMFAAAFYGVSSVSIERKARQIAALEKRGYLENNKPRRLRNQRDRNIGWISYAGVMTVLILALPSPFPYHQVRLQIDMLVAFMFALLLVPVWGVIWRMRLAMFDRNDEYAGAENIGIRDNIMHKAMPKAGESVSKGSAKEISAAKIPGFINPDANRGIGA